MEEPDNTFRAAAPANPLATPPLLLMRTQKYLLLGICAAGLALRLEGIGSKSLSHYDEGVYVYNGMQAAFGNPLDFNFDQPLHSPPFYPWMIAAICWLFQAPWPAAGVLVSSLAGVATLPVIFLIGRSLAGNGAGLVAAGLLAFSDLHVAFSRMALTDVTLTFWFALTIYSAIRLHDLLRSAAVAQGETVVGAWRWAILLGGFAACAWNTKYNGWMAVAIAVGAAAVLQVRQFLKPDKDGTTTSVTSKKLFLWLTIAGGITALGYLPWFLFVENNFPGGYRAITDHHRTYIGGIGAWPGNAWHLLLSLSAFRHFGWLLTCGAFTIAAVWVITRRGTFYREARAGSGGLTAFAVSLAAVGWLTACWTLGTDGTMMIGAVSAIVPAIWCGRYPQVLIATWVGTFLISVPLYHPFTRLLVPMSAASACLTAVVLIRAAGFGGHSTAAATHAGSRREIVLARGVVLVAAALCIAALAVAHPFGIWPSRQLWNRWSSRVSYRAVTDAILDVTEPDAFVICQAQPPLAVYVPRERLPIGNVAFSDVMQQMPAGRPCYLAVDFFWLHSQPSSTAIDAVRSSLGRLRAVATIDNDLDIATLCDFLTPLQVAEKISLDRDPPSHESAVPPPLAANQRDVITIFAIER